MRKKRRRREGNKLRGWRRKEGKGRNTKRKEYRELCERKRKEENGKWEKRAMEITWEKV